MSYFDSIVQACRREAVLNDQELKLNNELSNSVTIEKAFKHFDAKGDGKLDSEEFSNLLGDLFRSASGNSHKIEQKLANELFSIFSNNHETMDRPEFKKCWDNWIKTILRPISAIIIVDVQNDFITGSLSIKNCPAKEDGEQIVPVINRLLDEVPFDNIFYSQDWHPADHISFFDNLNIAGRDFDEESTIKSKDEAELFSNVVFKGPPKTSQTLWPRHCVQESDGANFHKDLKMHPQGITVQKGVNNNIDSYSAFFDNGKLAQTELDTKLKERGVTDVFVCGIATDVCVSYTANDAQDLGYRTILIQDACGGIQAKDILATKNNIKAKHGLVVNSTDVKNLVQGTNRPVELGYAKALNCKI